MTPNVSPLSELSSQRFLGNTFGQEQVIAVVSTSVTRLANNPNRVKWIMTNEGANDVRVANTPDISASSGWLLAQSGGIISMVWEEDGEVTGYEIYLIAAAGTPNVRFREVVRK